jgi:predicted nucleotide-binding protein
MSEKMKKLNDEIEAVSRSQTMARKSQDEIKTQVCSTGSLHLTFANCHLRTG